MKEIIKILSVYFLFSSNVFSQLFKIELVKDIRTGIDESAIRKMSVFGNKLYFTADNGVNGIELWKSDGTSLGTNLVADINTVGDLHAYPTVPVQVNNNILFGATDGINGNELFKYQLSGAGAGTINIVKNINAGISSSFPRDLTILNGFCIFSANDGISGTELWRSDGTALGTTLIEDYFPGTEGLNFINPFTFNNRVYFKTYQNQALHSATLTDVTGVVPVNIYNHNDLDPKNYCIVNDMVFMNGLGNTGITTIGRELFVLGTDNKIKLVKDIALGAPSSNPANLINVNGTLFFTANIGTKTGLFKSDGTSAGTMLIKELDIYDIQWGPQFAYQINGTYYFSGVLGGNIQLWKSDGTEAGTVLVKELYNQNDFGYVFPFFEFNGKLIFESYSPGYGHELWQSDGTEAGTFMIADINTGLADSYPNPYNFIIMNNAMYFQANDGVHGEELFKMYNCYGPTDNYTLKNGNWGDPTVWSCGRVPDTFESVKIKNHTINLNGNYSSAGIIFDVGGQLTIPTGNTLTKTIPPI